MHKDRGGRQTERPRKTCCPSRPSGGPQQSATRQLRHESCRKRTPTPPWARSKTLRTGAWWQTTTQGRRLRHGGREKVSRARRRCDRQSHKMALEPASRDQRTQVRERSTTGQALGASATPEERNACRPVGQTARLEQRPDEPPLAWQREALWCLEMNGPRWASSRYRLEH